MFFFSKNKKSAAKAATWLVVGLGNPGDKYEGTRHNAGFMALDLLADKYNIPLRTAKFKGLFGKGSIAGTPAILLKPMAYMNLSGESVAAAARYFKIPPHNTLVIYDDVSLPVGKMRIRQDGSDGGHNGIKNLGLHIGWNFPRIKIGVGRKPHPEMDMVDWVLSSFSAGELKELEPMLANSCGAVALILTGQLKEAQNRYN